MAKIIQSPAEIRILSEQYFLDCETANPQKPITIPGLAYALGFSGTRTLHTYRNADSHKEFHEEMNRAYLRVEQFNAEQLFGKGSNVAGPIFALKNMGWKDKEEKSEQHVHVHLDEKAMKLL